MQENAHIGHSETHFIHTCMFVCFCLLFWTSFPKGVELTNQLAWHNSLLCIGSQRRLSLVKHNSSFTHFVIGPVCVTFTYHFCSHFTVRYCSLAIQCCAKSPYFLHLLYKTHLKQYHLIWRPYHQLSGSSFGFALKIHLPMVLRLQ